MTVFNLLILLVLAAGHTELMVTLINRIHSLAIRRTILRRLRRLEDAVMVAFPFVLFWFVGIRGPALLRGGVWSDVPVGWRLYLGLCALGCGGAVWSVVRYWLRRPPVLLCSNHSHIVDVAKKLGHKPLKPGRMHRLAALPGNESFQIQVSDKRYQLPRLPTEWHELSILHLSDTHFIGTVDRPFFEEVARLGAEMRPDLIVFTGDLLDDLDYLPWLSETIGRLRAPLGCYYVLGNHDWFVGAQPVREEFDRCGWQGVAGRVISIEYRGHTLEIAGSERPWMGIEPSWTQRAANAEDPPGKRAARPTEELGRLAASPAAVLGSGKSAFRLVLSHSPDRLQWARSHGADLMLAGHNHGGQIVLPMIGPIFAPSRHGVRYSSGAFWADPTLLYVSRGLSARAPLRFNCRPELTRLVLLSPSRSE